MWRADGGRYGACGIAEPAAATAQHSGGHHVRRAGRDHRHRHYLWHPRWVPMFVTLLRNVRRCMPAVKSSIMGPSSNFCVLTGCREQPPPSSSFPVRTGRRIYAAVHVPAGYVGEQISAAEGRQLLEAMNPNPRRAGPSLVTTDFMGGGEVSALILLSRHCAHWLLFPSALSTRSADAALPAALPAPQPMHVARTHPV